MVGAAGFGRWLNVGLGVAATLAGGGLKHEAANGRLHVAEVAFFRALRDENQVKSGRQLALDAPKRLAQAAPSAVACDCIAHSFSDAQRQPRPIQAVVGHVEDQPPVGGATFFGKGARDVRAALEAFAGAESLFRCGHGNDSPAVNAAHGRGSRLPEGNEDLFPFDGDFCAAPFVGERVSGQVHGQRFAGDVVAEGINSGAERGRIGN